MAKKRLADLGLQSERLLWPTRGPHAKGAGVFEREGAALEQAVGLTTLEKAVAWAQSSPCGRTRSGSPAARSR